MDKIIKDFANGLGISRQYMSKNNLKFTCNKQNNKSKKQKKMINKEIILSKEKPESEKKGFWKGLFN